MNTPRYELRVRRNYLGLSALRVGTDAGIAEMRVYAIERGRCRPSRAEAVALARVLGTEPEKLFPELREGVAR